jgi:hypothetical protein
LVAPFLLAGLGWLTAAFAPQGQAADGEGEPEKAFPTRCDIKGKIDGRVARLTITYDFVTEKRNAALQLPPLAGPPSDLEFDGRRAAALREFATEKTRGYLLHVDRPGEHKLSFSMAVPLTVNGAARKLDVDLARSAITRVSLTLPPGTRDLQSGTPNALLQLNGNVVSGDLGAIDKLQLSWKGTPVSTDGPTPLSAVGTIEMAIETDGNYTTKATLQLAGQTNQWQFLAPPNAVLTVDPRDEPRVTIKQSERLYTHLGRPVAQVWTVTLKDASAEPLRAVYFALRGKLVDAARTPVGPFAVYGEARQSGTLTISNNDPTLLLQFFANPGTVSKQGTQSYTYVPRLPDRLTGTTGPGSLSLLDIQSDKIPPLIRTQVSHRFDLLPAEDGKTRFWQVQTTITATQVKPGADRFVVVLPPGWHLQLPAGERLVLPAPLKDPVVTQTPDGEVLTFAFQRRDWNTFTLTLKARYTGAVNEARQEFRLPRPRDPAAETAPYTVELQTITVVVPPDLELTIPEGGNAALRLTNRKPHEQVWQPEAAAHRPDAVLLAWQRYQPELHAASVFHVTLTPNRARVVQELKLPLPRGATEGSPLKLAFLLPAGVAPEFRSALTESLIVRRGGKLKVDAGGIVVVPERNGSADECRLILEYAVPLPADTAAGFPVPLLLPEAATTAETRVRVWADAGAQPQLNGSDWFSLPIEEAASEVPGDTPPEAERLKRLPVLVLRSTAKRPLLSLRLAEAAPKEGASLLADRALVRVTIHNNGSQQYRVSIRLLQTFDRPVDVKLPAPVALLPELKITLNGVRIDPKPVDEKTGQPAGEGSVARLRLPSEIMQPGAILEISYRLDPGRTLTSRFQTVLQPPLLAGDAGHIPTRWRITLAGGQVALGPEAGLGVRRGLRLRGWLPILAPADSNADLEKWLVGKDVAVEEEGPVSEDCFRTSLEPLTVTHAPQQSWLLACSLVVVLVGVGTYLLLRRTLRGRMALAAGVLVFVLAVAAVATALLLPTVSAALLYGCQPALVVLLLGGLVLWALHENARRRTSSVSSFSRSRHGSSLLRPSAVRQPGEPSTVDHSGPANGASSAEAARSSSSGT